jgi:hypothetical protein
MLRADRIRQSSRVMPAWSTPHPELASPSPWKRCPFFWVNFSWYANHRGAMARRPVPSGGTSHPARPWQIGVVAERELTARDIEPQLLAILQ